MPVDGSNILQICDLHEGLMEVVKLQNTGQQEEAWDQDTAEELRQFKRLQSHVSQPKDGESYALSQEIYLKMKFATSLIHPITVPNPYDIPLNTKQEVLQNFFV